MIPPDPSSSAPSQLPKQGPGEALAVGPPIEASLEDFDSLAGSLQAAAYDPEAGVLHYLSSSAPHFTHSTQSYHELYEAAGQRAAQLHAQGCRPDHVLVLMIEDAQDFLESFWAGQLLGMPVLPLAAAQDLGSETVWERLKSVYSLCPSAWVLTSPPVKQAWESRAADGPRLITLAELPEGGEKEVVQTRPEQTALLLLTSGSTGHPKIVALTHRNILTRCAASAQRHQYTSQDLSLNWMPLDHVGGIVMFHLHDVYAHAGQIQVPTQYILESPLRWPALMSRFRVTSTWAPNFAFALLNESEQELAEASYDLSALRFILNGGEAIAVKTARRFLTLFAPFGLPHDAVRPAWGMSETSSGITSNESFSLSSSSDDDCFVEVGAPLPGVSVRIVGPGLERELLREGEIGSVQVKGQSVMAGYLNNPEANAQSFTADGWFCTGDLGYLREGRLTITGREKDLIILNGINFYSHELEACLEELSEVETSYTAACAIQADDGQGEALGVFFTPSTPLDSYGELITSLRRHLQRRFGVSAQDIVPLPKEEIPKTEIGKIKRAALRTRYEAGLLGSVRLDQSLSQLAELEQKHLFVSCWEACITRADPPMPAALGTLLFDHHAGDQALALSATSPVILVQPAASFAQKAPLHYTIDPQQPEHYDTLLLSLREHGIAWDEVVYGWALRPALEDSNWADRWRTGQNNRVLPLLFLIQAFLRTRTQFQQTLRLWALTSGVFGDPLRPVTAPFDAPLLSLVKSVSSEVEGSEVRTLDLPGSLLQNSTELSQVLHEARAIPGGPPFQEIVYHQSTYYVERLVLPSPPPKQRGLSDLKGAIVITGGLGGIGFELARHLLVKLHATLLLLGRRTADDTSNQARLKQLQTLPGEVTYRAVDLTHREEVARVISAYCQTGAREISAVFHLAGSFQKTSLAELTAEQYFQDFEAKGLAAVHLDSALPSEETSFYYFSSLISQFSSYATAGYGAANRFLDAFAQAQNNRRTGKNKRSASFLWGQWTGLGMNSQSTDDTLVQALGYVGLDAQRGLAALQEAVATHAPKVLLGVNGMHPTMQPHLSSTYQKSLTHWSEQQTRETLAYCAPQTDLQRALVAIWQEVLKKERIGIHDRFFDLGGKSLTAARLFHKIEAQLGQSLPLATLFHAPTIATLAVLLEDQSPQAPSALSCRLLLIQKGQAPAEREAQTFFCVPGGGSDSVVFSEFARVIGPENTVYGLQAKGLDATRAAEILSVEDIATDFITEIKRVQAKGPYLLLGHCFGSLLIYEVAQQLVRAGEAPPSLFLLDPIVGEQLGEGILGRQRFVYHWKAFMALGLLQKVDYARRRIRNFSRTLVVRRRMSHSYDQAAQMHEGYSAQPSEGPLMVIAAQDSFYRLSPDSDPRRQWLTLSPLASYHEVPGDHDTMLRQPHIEQVAQLINRSLSARLPSSPTAPPSLL